MCVQLQLQTQAIQYFHAHTFSVKLRFWKSASIRNVCSDFTYSQAILKETQLSAHTGKLQHHLEVSDTLKMKYRFPFLKNFYLKGRVTERNVPCTGSLAQGTKAKDGPGWSQKPETLFVSPKWVAEARVAENGTSAILQCFLY